MGCLQLSESSLTCGPVSEYKLMDCLGIEIDCSVDEPFKLCNMSYPHQNFSSFKHNMYNNTFGIHQVVHPYQLGYHQSLGGNDVSSASVSYFHLDFFFPTRLMKIRILHNLPAFLTAWKCLSREHSAV